MTDSELDCIKRIGELKRERAELLSALRSAKEWMSLAGPHSEGQVYKRDLALVRSIIAKAERRP